MERLIGIIELFIFGYFGGQQNDNKKRLRMGWLFGQVTGSSSYNLRVLCILI